MKLIDYNIRLLDVLLMCNKTPYFITTEWLSARPTFVAKSYKFGPDKTTDYSPLVIGISNNNPFCGIASLKRYQDYIHQQPPPYLFTFHSLAKYKQRSPSKRINKVYGVDINMTTI